MSLSSVAIAIIKIIAVHLLECKDRKKLKNRDEKSVKNQKIDKKAELTQKTAKLHKK
jgi:hypothetical protein